MVIRMCPDCKGSGKHWRPPNRREQYSVVEHPEISSTAISCCRTILPEYEQCWLCAGVGEVEMSRIEGPIADEKKEIMEYDRLR